MTWRGVGFFGGYQPNAGNLTLQWWIDGSPIGNPITETIPNMTSIYFSSSYDTTLLANGTHVLWGRWVDSNATALNAMHAFSSTFVSNNPSGTFSQAAQDMYVSTPQNLILVTPGMPDILHYGGTPNPTQRGFPMPSVFAAGSSSASRTDLNSFWVQSPVGPRPEEYAEQLFWQTVYNGADFNPHGVYVGNANVEGPQDTPSSYQEQLLLPYQDGERGDCYVSPFATYKELPDGTVLFVEINGRLCLMTDGGTVTTIAGLTHDKSKLSFSQGYAANEALSESVKTVVGNFLDDIDLGSVQDIAFDSRNQNILYLPSLLDHIIIKVDMTGWPGTPATVSLWAGQNGVAGHANGSPLSATFNNPSSCVMDSSGNLYIADQGNCLIRKITTTSAGVAGTVSTVVGQVGAPTAVQAQTSPLTYSPTSTINFSAPAYIVYPSCIRINSTGGLCIYEPITYNCRRIDLGTSTVHYLGAYDNGSQRGVGSDATGWGWLGIDKIGNVGPVDDAILAIPGGDLQDGTWRVSTTNTPYSASYFAGAGFQLFTSSARGGQFPKVFHYNWAIEISSLQGKMWTSGLQAMGVATCRLLNVNDPPALANTEWYTVNSGYAIFLTGTCTCRGAKVNYFPQTGQLPPGNNTWPWELRPSFWAIRGGFGAGHLGVFSGANTFDEMHATYTTDAALGAYIQSGMGSSVPRPEITGNDLRDLIYFIRINTAAGSNYPTAVTPGADDADTGNFPTITSISAVRNANTAIASSITVSWTTNKPTIGFAAGGSPAQALLGSWPIFSPVENMTVPYSSDGPTGGGLHHSATINNLPLGVSPIHYIVQVRDMAGNAAYTNDQTIA
jgi:hypothetical protein